MKNLYLVIIIVTSIGLLMNCGSTEKTINELKKEIASKKGQINSIKKEIKTIEDKIDKETPKDEKKDNRVLINTKTLKYENFVHYINQNGSIEAVNSAFVSAELNGQIKKIFVKEGDFVKKGKLLIKLNSSVIEGSIKELKTSLRLSKIIYKKRKGLWDKKIGSEIQYLESKTNMDSLRNKLDTLNSQLEMTKIKAPISGIIETILPKVGELASPGIQLIQLINLDKIYVNTDVSEKYLPALKKGDWVELSFPSYPNLKRITQVYLTGNSINVKNRTFKIKVLIDNPDGKLKPNNLAIIKLKDFIEERAIVIPSIIVKRDSRGDYVYIVKKNKGRKFARKKYIKIGLSEIGKTMVLEGLKKGDTVILQGYNMVKDGIEVKLQKIVKQEKRIEQKIVD